ncbi:phage major tail protein, TP901-1 family [Staphylococcus ursi]|uniref:phage tail tube protein n=1 Tax=Staphylococcus sp. MI 10-1553 TaxID=1912064 RepID=UPI0013978431|nr:phage tail tube protein [Staphylococcus sp. MI 10-1553]QHW36877.1 phage major tail protein, TP901-1 family [Staphylococcus sp. MI 10-1553]QHW38062.1 phage major tail protein, TP901-1 family [Staphylococcus sp. MI 10-1553]
MADLVKGKDLLILLREKGKAEAAKKLMLGKEYKKSVESDGDTVDTFDGSFTTGGTKKTTFSVTVLMSREDSLPEEIEKGLGETVYEIWLADSKNVGRETNANKYKSEYMQGVFKKFDLKGEVGGIVEYEVEFNESGGGTKYGYATLPEEMKAKLTAAGYRFHDTTAADAVTNSTGNAEVENE